MFLHMFKKNDRKICGMIALFPAIIISGILLIISVSASQSFLGLLWRANLADEKVQSVLVVKSCARRVVALLMQNSGYTGSESIKIGDYDCEIKSVIVIGSEANIEVNTAISEAISVDKMKYNLTTQAIFVEEVF